MARKVTNISDTVDNYVRLSQTPKDYDKDNFFIKELQDKVNAEWRYRFNRVNVQYEKSWGKNNYNPLEVVVQHVKSDKANDYTDDYRRLVFKDIREKRFKIGSKFRFTPDYSIDDTPFIDDKTNPTDHNDIWLVTNFSSIKATTSAIVTRCNGTIGSTWVDNNNVTHYHYEPIIQKRDLTSTNFRFSDTVVSPESSFVGIVQHNDFTKNYYINQRFIIGYDQVFVIKAINKFYGIGTNDPHEVGLMQIYFEVTEKSAYDNFETRIAYQSKPSIEIQEEKSDNYLIKITKPEFIPTTLSEAEDGEEYPVLFSASLFNGEEKQAIAVDVKLELTNIPPIVDVKDPVEYQKFLDRYIKFEKINDNDFTLSLLRVYFNGDLNVKCYVPIDKSPTGEEISASFTLKVNGM